MNDRVVRGFNRGLGLQSGAVQQRFIHVPELRAWGEAAVADRSTWIDADIPPNVLRIVDFVVSAGRVPLRPPAG